MADHPDDWTNQPWLNADYRSQLDAVRSLFAMLYQFEDELEERIERVRESAARMSGDANEFATDEWIYLAHFSMFQHAAHSMAAVSMLASAVESAFKDVCQKIDRPLPLPEKATGGLVADIMRLAREEGMGGHLPNDLKQTLEAIFEYRNKMLHCGFEWPADEIVKFDRRRKDWPDGWFENAYINGAPWMFYMSRTFICRCLDTVGELTEGLGKFLVGHAQSQRDRPQGL